MFRVSNGRAKKLLLLDSKTDQQNRQEHAVLTEIAKKRYDVDEITIITIPLTINLPECGIWAIEFYNRFISHCEPSINHPFDIKAATDRLKTILENIALI